MWKKFKSCKKFEIYITVSRRWMCLPRFTDGDDPRRALRLVVAFELVVSLVITTVRDLKTMLRQQEMRSGKHKKVIFIIIIIAGIRTVLFCFS